jgi:hypothetical protein
MSKIRAYDEARAEFGLAFWNYSSPFSFTHHKAETIS